MKKQFKITLSEDQHRQLEDLIGELKIKRGLPILTIINNNIQEDFIEEKKTLEDGK